MNQGLVLLFVLTVAGAYGSRWLARLSPLLSELPLKTIAATVLCGVVALALLAGLNVASWLVVVAAALGIIYLFGPFALTALARGRNYGAASSLSSLLYWTPAGRAGLARLFTQVALRQGNGKAALRLIGEEGDELLRAQAYALQGRWREVLELSLPREGDNAFLGMGARAQAYLELGQFEAAQSELTAMERRWKAQGQGPLGYRAITLTQARLHAAKGDFEAVRKGLEQPLPGVPPYVLLDTLGTAAERAGHPEVAVRAYLQAYAIAPEGQRGKFAEKLERYGQGVPEVRRRGNSWGRANLALMVSIAIAYGLQLLINQHYGANAASAVGGFLLNIRGIPDSSAPWRYLSYAFLHAGLLHIGINLWVLFDIGRIYEARRHWGSLLAAFTIGAAMGAYFVTIAQGGQQLVLIGASGGILGVAGALLADTLRGHGPQDRVLTRALLQWIGLLVIFSLLLPGVSLWGHIGGLVGGLLWGFVRQGLPQHRNADLFMGSFSIAFMTWALFMAGMWLARYSSLLH
jgi:membrane associated rhomboid family serine protease